MPMSSTQLEAAPVLLSNRQTIAKGSKSFYLASLFFTPEQRTGAWKLYRWCRACDDRIDEAPSREHALVRLTELRERTKAATSGASTASPEFEGLREICIQYGIPSSYPLDLVEGFAMDVAGYEYRTLADVELYSYRVAGVVGLMICHVTGVRNPLAHPHAVALGTAMQLTNIARDVRDDFDLGRVYLPKEWLRDAGVIDFWNQKPQLFSVVERLLDRADEQYKIGYAGLKYLPFRAALAVSIAGSIYSAIGHKIRASGPNALDSRAVVSLPHKLWLVVTGTLRALRRRSL